MNNPTKRTMPTQKVNQVINLFGLVFILATWLLMIFNYAKLPNTIPIHFNAIREPDGFGQKEFLFTLPVIATIVYFGLGYLQQFPHLFNYPVKVTENNAVVLFRIATNMIKCIQLGIAIIFCYLVFATIQTATGKATGLGFWFLPLTVCVLLLPIIYCFLQMRKLK